MTTPTTAPSPILQYVAYPSADGSSSMLYSHPGGYNGVYITLPLGVLTVQVTWAGAGEISFRVENDGTLATRWTAITIPAGTAGTARTRVAVIPIDNPEGRFYVRFEGTLATDKNYRAGITIMNTSAL